MSFQSSLNDPEIFPGIEGLKPLGQATDLVPDILDESLIDRRIDVTLDQAVYVSGSAFEVGMDETYLSFLPAIQ